MALQRMRTVCLPGRFKICPVGIQPSKKGYGACNGNVLGRRRTEKARGQWVERVQVGWWQKEFCGTRLGQAGRVCQTKAEGKETQTRETWKLYGMDETRG